MMPAKRSSQNWLPSVFNDFFGNEWIAKASSSMPAVNIKETPTEYTVDIAAPGLTKDDFKVKVNDDNQLVVTVQKKTEKEEKDEKGKYLRREFGYTEFQQTLILPDNVEKDKIQAKAENGVLSIDIPKKPAPAPEGSKDIEVK
ncbi:MAG: Hsp20/alpha crystallin family protein [Bacteroidales bacterium]